jgi:hypothetical protein
MKTEANMTGGAMPSRGDQPGADPCREREPDMDRIRSAIRGIRYGEVRAVIQDGVIVQIERIERQRLR